MCVLSLQSKILPVVDSVTEEVVKHSGTNTYVDMVNKTPLLNIQTSDDQELETIFNVFREVSANFFAATAPSVRRRSGAQMKSKRGRDYVYAAQGREHDLTATLPQINKPKLENTYIKAGKHERKATKRALKETFTLQKRRLSRQRKRSEFDLICDSLLQTCQTMYMLDL